MASKVIKIQVTGLGAALNRLQELGDRAPEAAATLLTNFVNTQVIAPAKDEYVPVDTGALRATIQASEPVVGGTKVSVSVSAGGPSAPYALSVHENPRSGQTGGVSPQGKKYKSWARVGGWKFLELPALAAATSSAGWLADEARALLQRMKG
jgi:hypothetical protein